MICIPVAVYMPLDLVGSVDDLAQQLGTNRSSLIVDMVKVQVEILAKSE